MFDLALAVLLSLPVVLSTRYGRENVDPARADPRGEIICDFDGLHIDDLQAQLDLYFCAKPQYGGLYSNNLGGYCGYRLRPRQLTFDNSYWTWTGPSQSNGFWQNYCQNRCRCVHGAHTGKPWPTLQLQLQTQIISPEASTSPGSLIHVGDGSLFVHQIEPFGERFDTDTAFERASSGTDFTDAGSAASEDGGPEDNIDQTEIYYSAGDSELLDYGPQSPVALQNVLTLRLPIGSQTAMHFDARATRAKWVSLDPDSRVSCAGDLPSWLPDDIDPSMNLDDSTVADTDTPILQRLCATTLSGGNPNVNTGGVCQKDTDTDTSYVIFSDVWAGTHKLTTKSIVLSEAVRAYCYLHCQCPGRPRPSTNIVPSRAIPHATWNGDAEVQSDARGVSFTFLENGASRTIHLDPNSRSEPRVHHRHSSCLVKQDGICSVGPPVSVAVSHLETSDSSCGGQCQSMSECGGSPGTPCKCGVDLSKAMTSGMDRVFGATFCVAQLAIQINSNPKLGGRDEDCSHACVCNSTYVSFGCCGSETGMIWESIENRLGRLDGDLENLKGFVS